MRFVFRLVLSIVMLAAGICLVGQEAPTFDQRQSIGQTWIQFSQCLTRSDPGCLLALTSSDGVSVGVDEPRVSKQEFKNELRASASTQCFFWADRCGRKSSNPCSLSRYTQSTSPSPRYSKPNVHDGHWQIEVTVPHFSDLCEQDIPITFQLEDGFWRIVTIPFT
jgi:hypothetical protein